ncbi:MAG: arginine repressor [Actinobacteria bacterium]|nr:MAG: arginine repressor [Actinomycetota bacterium]
MQAYREAGNAKRPRAPHIYSPPMQREPRPLEKEERQRLITSIVTRRRVGTQNELLDALARAGCRVTQATISRDIRELGLDKTHDVLGRPRYVAPQAVRSVDPRDALAGVLSQFGRRVEAAQNIVVVQTELGSAPAVARALDRLEHPRIVGTIAGDDTCVAIARNNRDAVALARDLAELVG